MVAAGGRCIKAAAFETLSLQTAGEKCPTALRERWWVVVAVRADEEPWTRNKWRDLNMIATKRVPGCYSGRAPTRQGQRVHTMRFPPVLVVVVTVHVRCFKCSSL